MSHCPLAHFVRGTPRMIARGHACTYTGGRCNPSNECDDRIKEILSLPKEEAE